MANASGVERVALNVATDRRRRHLMDACDIARKNGTTTIVITTTSVALRIGGATLQPILLEMKNKLRSKCYALNRSVGLVWLA